MKRFDGDDSGLLEKLSRELGSASRDPEVEKVVSDVIELIGKDGDSGLLDLTERFDGVRLKPDCLRVAEADLVKSQDGLPEADRRAIEEAIDNIRAFHEQGHPRDWTAENSHGGVVGERHYPINRVGLYVPGGSVPLVSTVLMTATLAKVAGVPEIAVATPPGPEGTIDSSLLAALAMAGIDEVYRIGGAQAVAAFALGTKTVPQVDKIFGPGNAYVNEAKRQVFGLVGVDLLPGPSEVMVLCDGTARPPHVAAALLAQAEHGSGKEKVFLVSLDSAVANDSLEEMKAQAETLAHKESILRVLDQGLFVVDASTEEQAIAVANFVAPEHLELQVEDSRLDRLTGAISTAGAILQGHDTPTVLGDFAAGPSHVLPTGRAARFSSGLRLSDFYRRSSILRYDVTALAKAEQVVACFASMESLDAHGQSLSVRLDKS
mgnify:CR=1 FL=1